MPVLAVGWDRTETVDWQLHGAAMLATTATTCRNGLLPLNEGQSKPRKLQEEHQTGKRPAHKH